MITRADLNALIALAVITAHYQHDWIPGTSFEEVYDQDKGFEKIIATANSNLIQVLGEGTLDRAITDKDVICILWNNEQDEYDEYVKEMELEV